MEPTCDKILYEVEFPVGTSLCFVTEDYLKDAQEIMIQKNMTPFIIKKFGTIKDYETLCSKDLRTFEQEKPQ